jgi:hypothetical protein
MFSMFGLLALASFCNMTPSSILFLIDRAVSASCAAKKPVYAESVWIVFMTDPKKFVTGT